LYTRWYGAVSRRGRRQWTLIKRVIDDCDYYIVIIGGRYGSIGPDDKSFTQLEYEYAIEQGKPVIAFLHKEPGKLPSDDCEKDPDKVAKLDEFRELAEQKMVRYWNSPADLGSAVSRSLIKLIKTNRGLGASCHEILLGSLSWLNTQNF
jgi:hypothetical protein